MPNLVVLETRQFDPIAVQHPAQYCGERFLGSFPSGTQRGEIAGATANTGVVGPYLT